MCVDCGLVLERIVGGMCAGGGGGLRHLRGSGGGGAGGVEEGEELGEEAAALTCMPPPPPVMMMTTAMGGDEGDKRLELRDILSVFHLDNAYLLELVLHNYNRVYGRRAPRADFKKTRCKERVAMAFSICNVLARERMPRPVHYVAGLCGLHSARPLLNLSKTLNFNLRDLFRLDACEYELTESSPSDYVGVLCADLGVSFAVAGKIRDVLDTSYWCFYGRRPTLIAAAAAQMVLQDLGQLTARRAADICVALACQQKAVSEGVRRFRQLLKADDFRDLFKTTKDGGGITRETSANDDDDGESPRSAATGAAAARRRRRPHWRRWQEGEAAAVRRRTPAASLSGGTRLRGGEEGADTLRTQTTRHPGEDHQQAGLEESPQVRGEAGVLAGDHHRRRHGSGESGEGHPEGRGGEEEEEGAGRDEATLRLPSQQQRRRQRHVLPDSGGDEDHPASAKRRSRSGQEGDGEGAALLRQRLPLSGPPEPLAHAPRQRFDGNPTLRGVPGASGR